MDGRVWCLMADGSKIPQSDEQRYTAKGLIATITGKKMMIVSIFHAATFPRAARSNTGGVKMITKWPGADMHNSHRKLSETHVK